MTEKLWKLPVPSTAVLGAGVAFEKRLGRVVALRFSYESESDEQHVDEALVFERVEALKITYYSASDESMLEAYDQLVDLGATPWLAQLRSNLERRKVDAAGLKHLMILFDDGPCYEVVCRGFRIERP